MLESEQQQSLGQGESWFDRFYKLANALYAQDDSGKNGICVISCYLQRFSYSYTVLLGSGNMERSRASWLIDQYNKELRLGISNANIEEALSACQDGANVNIDPLLKALMMYQV